MFLKKCALPILLLIVTCYAADWTADPDCLWALTMDQTSGDMLDLCGTFNGDMDLVTPAPPLRAEGKFFGSAHFPSGNYLPFGDVTFMDGLSEFTMSFWLDNSEDYSANERNIIRKDGAFSVQDSAAQERVYLWTSAYPLGFNFIIASDNYPTDFYFEEDGNWHMYTITYDGSTITAFRDCVEINSDALTGTIKNSSNQLTLGSIDPVEGGINYVYKGRMDDVIYLGREIDSGECTDLMTNGIDGSAGYYPKIFQGRGINMRGVTINGG